jgi:hypothetical protein
MLERSVNVRNMLFREEQEMYTLPAEWAQQLNSDRNETLEFI